MLEPEQGAKLNNLEALESKEVNVSKIGGDNASDIFGNYNHVKRDLGEGKKRILVISAIRSSDEGKYGGHRHSSVASKEGDSSSLGFNTTNHLIEIAHSLKKGNLEQALEIIKAIERFMTDIVSKNLSQDELLSFDTYETLIKKSCESLRNIISTKDLEVIDLKRDQCVKLPDGIIHSITSFGENLARDIYALYFKQKAELSTTKVLVEDLYKTLGKTSDITEIITNSEIRKKAREKIIAKISQKVDKALKSSEVIIIGGHASVLATEKGFSEKIAAVVAGASEATGRETSFSIEKQYPLMSIDPSIAKLFDLEPKVLAKISPGMIRNLMEEAFANAGAVQSDALVHTLKTGVDIFVYNPEQKREHMISRITDYAPEVGGIENVSLRDATTINVDLKNNSEASPQEILGELLRWTAKNKYKVLFSSTSASKISITLNDEVLEENFDQLKELAKEKFKVEPSKNSKLSSVFVLGNNMRRPGVLSSATRALFAVEINVIGVNQGNDEQAMVFCVEKEKELLAAAAIHKCCIEMTLEGLSGKNDKELYNLLEPLRDRAEEIRKAASIE